MGLTGIRTSIAALLSLSAPLASASSAPLDAGVPFDCTIEPRIIAEVGSADEGIIEEVSVQRGDRVAKGQVLAVLESKSQELTVDLARLRARQDVEVRSRRARLGFQKSEQARAETLFEKRLLSDKLRDEAKVQAEIARLDLESAAFDLELSQVELSLAEERLSRRTIRSPIDGIVTEVSKSPGEYIHEQAPLLTVAHIEQLKVEVFVPVLRYGQISLNQAAVVEPVQPIGGRYPAVVEVVDRVFDAASGTFGVRLRLDNSQDVLPAGIRCTVRFQPPDQVASGLATEDRGPAE